jgi:hypothetical protein
VPCRRARYTQASAPTGSATGPPASGNYPSGPLWRVATYNDADKALIVGVLASVINHAFVIIDELAISQGELFRGEDLLATRAIGLEPPEGDHSPG